MVKRSFYLYLILGCVAALFLGGYAFSEEMPGTSKEPLANIVAPAEVTSPEVVAANTEPAVRMEAPAAVMPTMNAEVPQTVAPAPAEAKPAVEETRELKWVWGEVASVDAASNKLVIKYLNYDTDIEETLTIAVDAATRFENAEEINAVKAGDNVGVDYTVDAYGGAIAKSIALEKAELMPATTEEMPKEMAPAQGTAPVTQETTPDSQLNAAVEVPSQQ